MLNFEILCVTMGQKDFSKIQQMNIHSNVVFANQADECSYNEVEFENHKAKMITTTTRGVGKNRNIALIHASADICLFADDDVVYNDDVEKVVTDEFTAHPDADIIIFHFDTDGTGRKQKKYPVTKKHGRFSPMPWGGVRIAVRLESIKKANVWFSTLFGGGCVFPSGEDSMWLLECKRKGLTFYVSKETIGKISFAQSSWFTGYDERFYFGKGAFYQALHPKSVYLWMLYFAFRTKSFGNMRFGEKMKCMQLGRQGYDNMLNFDELREKQRE